MAKPGVDVMVTCDMGGLVAWCCTAIQDNPAWLWSQSLGWHAGRLALRHTPECGTKPQAFEIVHARMLVSKSNIPAKLYLKECPCE